MKYILIWFGLVVGLAGSLPAQSEAQALEDVLIFQNVNKPHWQHYILRPTDKIKYPVLANGRIRSEIGRVESIGDSTLVIFKRTGERSTLNLNQTAYINVIRRNSRWFGIFLVVICGTLVLAAVIASLVAFSPGSVGILAVIWGGVTEEIPRLVVLGLGLLLWGTSVKRMWLDKWRYRKGQREPLRRWKKNRKRKPVRKVVPSSK